MKIIKNLVIWSIVAIVFQSLVFFAADRYYETSLLNTKTTEVKIEDTSAFVRNVTIKIPSSATKIASSFDGQYLSYYENDKLNVINTYDGTKQIVSEEKSSKQIYSKWQPDINLMILCEKSLDNPKDISIYTYNADNNSKETPTDSSNADIKLTLNSSNDKISDIEFSTAMNTFYIKTLKANETNDIFFNDVNGNMKSLITSENIGTVRTFKNKPGLLFEDLSNNVIKFTNENKSIAKENYCILYTDDNENVYMGVLKNGLIDKILYGTTDKSISQWQSINLQSPINKDSVIITNEGKIYIKYNDSGYIIDERSNKKTSYKGNFLSITDKELLSIENGNLQRVKLN